MDIPANSPFLILDSYSDESYVFYSVMRSIIDIPYIPNDDTEISEFPHKFLEAQLYELAFASVCNSFLCSVGGAKDFWDTEEAIDFLNLSLDVADEDKDDDDDENDDELTIYDGFIDLLERNRLDIKDFKSEKEALYCLIDLYIKKVNDKLNETVGTWSLNAIFQVYGDTYKPSINSSNIDSAMDYGF